MKQTEFQLKNARKCLPKREKHSHKADAGRALIIAGSRGMYGAAVLAATAAARSGAGYVQLITDLRGFSSSRHPDFLTAEITKVSLEKLHFRAVGLGPGLQSVSLAKKFLQKLKKLKCESVVVDAGALSTVGSIGFSLPSTWIMTPHEGELAKMLRVPAQTIRRQRKKMVRLAQKKFGGIVLLKGHDTLVCDGRRLVVIKSGNAALAKAGTGDVLTGMITGFLAQGTGAFHAATLGAFVHGKIADDWLGEKKDVLSLLASDLLDRLPRLYGKFEVKPFSSLARS